MYERELAARFASMKKGSTDPEAQSLRTPSSGGLGLGGSELQRAKHSASARPAARTIPRPSGAAEAGAMKSGSRGGAGVEGPQQDRETDKPNSSI